MKNIITFYNKHFPTSLKNEEQEKILKEINELIPNDKPIKIDNIDYPENTLVLFHLISDYHLAYTKSINDKEVKKDTLESLGKGNRQRQKRFDNNKIIIEDKNSDESIKIVAFFENVILEKILKGDYKFAYLILSFYYIYNNYLTNLFKMIFPFNKKVLDSIDYINDAMKFFEFTYLNPSKIVNSCAISLHQYIKHCTSVKDEEKQLKFIRGIINIYFSKHASNTLRNDSLEKEIYCAGIYNGTPIFQWYTSTKYEEYYTNDDIDKYYELFNKQKEDDNFFKDVIINNLSKKTNKKDINNELNSKEGLKNLINNLSVTYVKQPTKLVKVLNTYSKKTALYYIFTPIRLLVTLLTSFATKLTRK